jgi:hypothetical protein
MISEMRVLKNEAMKKSFGDEANILGAIWAYCNLKKVMLDTLEKGFPSEITRSKGHLIHDEVCYISNLS